MPTSPRARPPVAALLVLLLCLPAALPGAAAAQGNRFENPIFGTFTKVFRKAEGAVVNVRATRGVSTGVRDRFREVGESEGGGETAVNVVRLSLSLPFYFAQSALSFLLSPVSDPPGEMGQGTGFVIDESGLVLTAAHVVADSDRVEVRFYDDRMVRATVVASDPDLDVALLKLPDPTGERRYEALPLGSKGPLRAGRWVMAVGSPFGLEQTVTVGVLLTPSRRLDDGLFREYIEIDATVDPGSSGGPLFDQDGRVIGINTTAVDEGSDLGFAIPIRAVQAVLRTLQAGDTPTRGRIGVEVKQARPSEVAGYDGSRPPGLWIREVEADSPADRVGLREGDLLVRLAHHQVRTLADYDLAQRDLIAGATTAVSVYRDGRLHGPAITPVAPEERED